MELPSNPFAILTFISAPAVLTNASCVLLFGTGNRYGRAVDRVHELADQIQSGAALDLETMQLKIRQLQFSEHRALLIVRALTCFYTAVAGFVASTLVSLVGAVLVSTGFAQLVTPSFSLAFLAGAVGVGAMITGAVLLARETSCSFSILREEGVYLTRRVQTRLAESAGSELSPSSSIPNR